MELVTIKFTDEFVTSNATDLNIMFFNCQKLVELDISTFTTTNVTNIYRMFGQNYNLKTIYVNPTQWLGTISADSNVFESCSNKLVGGTGVSWNGSNIKGNMAKVDGGYFTDIADKPTT